MAIVYPFLWLNTLMHIIIKTIIYYCQIYKKSLDADDINEIANKLIKVSSYKHYILIKANDFIEILDCILYIWVYFP